MIRSIVSNLFPFTPNFSNTTSRSEETHIHCPILSEETLAQLLYVCETMAYAADRKQSLSIKNVPEIEKFPSIQNEIMALQKSLHMDRKVSV